MHGQVHWQGAYYRQSAWTGERTGCIVQGVGFMDTLDRCVDMVHVQCAWLNNAGCTDKYESRMHGQVRVQDARTGCMDTGQDSYTGFIDNVHGQDAWTWCKDRMHRQDAWTGFMNSATARRVSGGSYIV